MRWTRRSSCTWRIGGDEETVQLRVGPDGQLAEVLLNRWGNPDGQPFARYPFGVPVDAERTFDEVTVPSTIRAGWCGTEGYAAGEFFRAEITDAVFG